MAILMHLQPMPTSKFVQQPEILPGITRVILSGLLSCKWHREILLPDAQGGNDATIPVIVCHKDRHLSWLWPNASLQPPIGVLVRVVLHVHLTRAMGMVFLEIPTAQSQSAASPCESSKTGSPLSSQSSHRNGILGWVRHDAVLQLLSVDALRNDSASTALP